MYSLRNPYMIVLTPYAQYSFLGLYTNEVLINRKMLSVGIGLGVKL
jgi:hypothetical protein